jgi:Co/Zn/Cd efflux system component
MAALINVVLLVGACAFIVFETVERFQHPQAVAGRIVMALAAVGIAGNWNVSSNSVAFSCHVVVPDQAVSRTQPLAQKIRRDLLESFGIDHPVLQFETAECGEGELLCQLACGGGSSGHA